MRTIFLALLLVAPTALAQVVFDDFSDGDFTQNPAWTGDTERFTVVPFGTDFALRSDGLAQADTIALATASTVAFGRWQFLFRHEVNLSNANGARVFLLADAPDFHGEVLGYYVQFGTNNSDRVELWRRDGTPEQRTRIGMSEELLPGDANTITITITRDSLGAFSVFAADSLLFTASDLTHTTSAALGLWVKHAGNGRDRFFLDDVLADPDPGDITPPRPTAATVTDDGSTLLVWFDEPLDPASVSPDAFDLQPGTGPPETAALDAPDRVRLGYDPAIEPGSYTLTVAGVADLAGNVQPSASLALTYAPDTEPPNLIAAEALGETLVRVRFDEPVLGCEATRYEVTPGIGTPVGIACPAPDTYELSLGAPLVGPGTYTVTARDVPDLAGNVQPETSASFFFGTFDVPGLRDVVVNEIMHSPSDLASNEWIELYNRTEGTFDLAALQIANDRSNPIPIATTPVPLPPGGHAVLVRNPDAFAAAFPGVPFVAVASFPVLRNSGDAVRLLRADGVSLDSVRYASGWGGSGVSIERLDPAGPSTSASNWASTLDPRGGTPGALNSVYAPDVEPPRPLTADPSNDGLSLVVAFDEPLAPETVTVPAFSIADGPSVSRTDYEPEATEVVLTLAEALAPGIFVLTVAGVADLVGNVQAGAAVTFEHAPDLDPPVVLSATPLDATTLDVRFDEPLDADSAETPTHYAISGGVGAPAAAELLEPSRVRLTLAVALGGPQTYTLTVSGVTDVFGNVLSEQTVAFFFAEPEPAMPGDLVISEIMHSPTPIASNEWVELFNASDKVLDLAALTLSDQGAPRPIASEPTLVPPGAFAVLVRNATAFADAFPEVPFVAVAGFPTLLNGGDAVVVRDAEGVVVDSVFYRPAWGGQGVSIERRNAEGPSNSPANWASSPDPRGGTPGAPNAVAPDDQPPVPQQVDPSLDGRSLAVTFDEPLDPASVSASAFSLSNGPAITATGYVPETLVVELTLGAALAAGSHTLRVEGVGDLLGNVQPGAPIAFAFEPDVTPPRVTSVAALDARTIRVRFSEPVEPVSAGERTHYAIAPGSMVPDSVSVALREADLHLSEPLAEGVVYTLTVSGVADLVGNAMGTQTVPFLLGDPDLPAPGDIVLTELMFREAEGSTEYVELHNRTANRVFDLSALTLSDQGTPRRIAETPVLLLPGTYLALARDLAALRRTFGPDGEALEMRTLPTLNNSGDAVVLRHEALVLDSVFYAPSWHRPELRDARGVALERLDAAAPTLDPANWTSSLDPRGGTPGRANSVALPPGEAPSAPGLTVTPSPFDADIGTVVRYRLASDAGLIRVRVFDGAGRLVRTLERAALAGQAGGEVLWDGRDERGDALRVGIYIVLLEALDVAGARTEAYRAPVVLARGL